MNYISYFPILVVIIFLLVNRKQEKEYIQARLKRRKGDLEMQELAKRFIGKDVYINTISSGNADGILKEVVENSILLDHNGETVVVNLDYVIKIREYPKNKNGKRKTVFD